MKISGEWGVRSAVPTSHSPLPTPHSALAPMDMLLTRALGISARLT